MKNDRVRKQLHDIFTPDRKGKALIKKGDTEKEMSFEIVRCLYLFFEIKWQHGIKIYCPNSR